MYDNIHASATDLSCNVRLQLREDLFKFRAWVHPSACKRSDAVGQGVVPDD